MATEKPRLAITVDDETMKRIEDFRFDNRIQNRSEAIRQLILFGLSEYEKRKASSSQWEWTDYSYKRPEGQPETGRIKRVVSKLPK